MKAWNEERWAERQVWLQIMTEAENGVERGGRTRKGADHVACGGFHQCCALKQGMIKSDFFFFF